MTSENNIKGAEWRKWDLHVHTPKSIYQKFGTDNSETWEQYISDLENLTHDFAVIGINDYLFLDGYEKLKKEQSKNERLKHLKLLPVVEFRIEKFAGVQFGNLKRINLHVIFSDSIAIETIRSQFLNTLEQSYTLEDGNPWTRAITYESVEELGAEIKSKVPEEQLSRYGSDLTEGFNNLNVSESQIFKSLEKDCFKDKFLIAVGKTEWGDLKWTDASIATKKSIINSADLIFTSAKSISDFDKAKTQLKTQGVNDLLLDCSDAHYFSNGKDKDRIGNCNTWIKADPTFDGLKQIINEPKGRIFIGENPPLFERVSSNRTKYIKGLNVSSIEGYDGRYGKWFKNISIPLNKELVAIIGNKGSGKSAIADMLALCSDYNNQDDFSFLKRSKFRDGKHANNFNATLTWESDKTTVKNLADNNVIGSIEEVKYLPQGQFERLTNEISNTEEFQNEIEKVVFAHIDESDRYGKLNFKELIDSRQQSVEKELDFLISELSQINQDIINLEAKENPTFKKELESKKQQKEEEFKALVEPPTVTDPNIDAEKKKANEVQIAKIDQLKKDIESLESQKTSKEQLKSSLLLNLQFLKDTKRDIELKSSEIQSYVDSKKEELTNLGINILEVIKFKTDFTKIDSTISVKEQELTEIKKELGEQESDSASKSIPLLLQEKNQILKEEQAKLGTEQSKYQQYLLDKKAWITKQNEIKGTNELPNTIEFFASSIKYIENDLQNDLRDKYEQRIKKTKEVFIKKYEVVNIYKAIKEKLDAVIDKNSTLLDKYPININASMVLKSDFVKKFMSFINKQKAGTFKGIIDGEYQLNKMISETDFDNEDSILTFLTGIISALKDDKRENQNGYRFIGEQVSEIKEFYSYLFSLKFLDYNYQLKQGDKNLEQLSPGERGALLLIFYLLLDKNDIPLIIDQPEDNLDNYSVANILVPFIKEAKKKRQIIMVTHNPNLAVVADAEQIIYVDLDKENGYEFTVISGSIENNKVNNCIVKVLEGAMPAFNKRKQKYYEN
ncbi:TrlF family AAA-like ATPase [Marinifilum flexuosum]|uniref:TrlF family AAA-like ATPase n=1 Tax=Marinifilum flexuosum TaxID=1117708 RepID=UPI0024911CCC|nr:AAA family ATPase [Marinifilum flexuosum]